jgi:hypothetical protein
MTRYERKLFFERLLNLREAYRAEAHASIEMTIEDALTFAAETYNDLVEADAYAAAATAAADEPHRSATD